MSEEVVTEVQETTMSEIRNLHRKFLKPKISEALRVYRDALPEGVEMSDTDRQLVRRRVREENFSLKVYARENGLMDVILSAHAGANLKPKKNNKKSWSNGVKRAGKSQEVKKGD